MDDRTVSAYVLAQERRSHPNMFRDFQAQKNGASLIARPDRFSVVAAGYGFLLRVGCMMVGC